MKFIFVLVNFIYNKAKILLYSWNFRKKIYCRFLTILSLINLVNATFKKSQLF